MSTSDIDILAHLLSKLPGLGKRSARRTVLHMLKHKDTLMEPLIEALTRTKESIITCNTCGNIDVINPCHICNDINRLEKQLCVVEDVADLWAIERSKLFTGKYHVLGGTLSAIDGRGPDDLNIEALLLRIHHHHVEEIILATNATVDGQTTAYYIMERLKDCNITISRIAHGIPIGGELDYLDEGTLNAAFQARRPF